MKKHLLKRKVHRGAARGSKRAKKPSGKKLATARRPGKAKPLKRDFRNKSGSAHKSLHKVSSHSKKTFAVKNRPEKYEVVQADPADYEAIEKVISQPSFLNYMSSNVGGTSVDVLKLLVKNTQTDEGIAAKLNMKINEVRRMLNVMNGYSILRYDTNKDNKGWLIFKWRIDKEKLFEFEKNINRSIIGGDMLSSTCNDFFFCSSCYLNNKVVLPFDTAFETNFRCVGCGKALNMLDQQQTAALFK